MVFPVDGYPCLADWKNNLKDILAAGCESHREATEIRPLVDDQLGETMTPYSASRLQRDGAESHASGLPFYIRTRPTANFAARNSGT